MDCNFILFVRDQEASTQFYKTVFAKEPSLNVPGMTEFKLAEKCTLGLMPEKGIKNILGSAIKDPETTSGIARSELYLTVPEPKMHMDRAINAGGRILSEVKSRNWGDLAGYVADPDGHVIAFATKS
jgi:uncharacterized glyoxalase superfamily protein PhnB